MTIKAEQPKQTKGEQLLRTRLAVVQTLYSEHLSDKPHIQNFAWLDEEQHYAVDEDFYQKLLGEVHYHDVAIMPMVQIALAKRQWRNMDILYQCLLRAACAELMAGINDKALVISLYCRICDAFYDDKMGQFTNAVLENCATQMSGKSADKPTSKND
ncbi:MAG: hypothetical protein K0U45_06345 [Alphaproteobacteria bacterium]|nr:hypothetical protein [Alphaproteobacteria bacterium]